MLNITLLQTKADKHTSEQEKEKEQLAKQVEEYAAKVSTTLIDQICFACDSLMCV